MPVHDEPGAVQFQYKKGFSALGAGLGLGTSDGGGAAPPAAWQERPQAVEPARLPPALELDEFISLDVEPAAAQPVGLGSGRGRQAMAPLLPTPT